MLFYHFCVARCRMAAALRVTGIFGRRRVCDLWVERGIPVDGPVFPAMALPH